MSVSASGEAFGGGNADYGPRESVSQPTEPMRKARIQERMRAFSGVESLCRLVAPAALTGCLPWLRLPLLPGRQQGKTS